MRSQGALFKELTSFAALHAAWRRAARGKRGRPDVCAFERVWPDGLVALSNGLRSSSWRPAPYRTFPFEEHGKRRLISAAPFPDRIVHHAITAVIEPIWERRFLAWSFANRQGRGTHAAMLHAARGAHRFRYSLQMDVRRFFPSADHGILMTLVARHVRERPMLDLIALVVSSGAGVLASEWIPALFPGDDLVDLARPKGLPIGNQTSQFLSNVLLHPLDLFIAERIKPGAAARYVDDFVLFDSDLGKLREAKHALEEKLASLRLVAHPAKTQLRATKEGLTFVGYRITPRGVRLPRTTVTRFRHKLRVVAEAYGDGAIDLAQAKQSISGLLGHARPAHAEAVMRDMLDDFPLVRSL